MLLHKPIQKKTKRLSDMEARVAPKNINLFWGTNIVFANCTFHDDTLLFVY